jgi:hypothetical protein
MTAADMGPAVAAFLSGVIESVGVLLVVAGAGKLYGALRGTRQESAVRQAFRIAPRQWRIAQLAAGIAECATGLVVCGRILPAEGGAAMAGLGLVFGASLIHARRVGASGGCGCIGWRHRFTFETIKLREITRAGWIVIAGILSVAMPWSGPLPFREPVFYAGAASGCLILVLMSVDAPPAILRCGWRRWRVAPGELAALLGHPVFKAMAESAGPFTSEIGHSRAGCTEEYWFTNSRGPLSARQVTAFSVTHLPGGALAVHARLLDSMPDNLRMDRWPEELATSRDIGRQG